MRTAVVATLVVALSTGFALAQTGHLYGIADGGDGSGVIYEIDTATGAASFVVELDADFGLLGGLTFLGGQLYATGLRNIPGAPTSGSALGHIDLATGHVTYVSDLDGRINVQGLASNEAAGVFYGIDGFERKLLSITPSGIITPIGDTTPDGRGMAYDDGAGVLYAISLDDNLYTVDTLTGAGTLIGAVDIPPTGFDQSGLAFDEFTRTLYVNDAVGDSLWIIDTATGAPTLVGANGVDGITGLAWVPSPGASIIGIAMGGWLARRRR
ncbi:MAG: hypothetical protein R3B57_12000 [Phycisphaerales bacterium]